MQDRYYETCASEELKEQKVYYVQKCKVEHHTYDWVFRAYFKKGICGRKKFLSELNAIDGGLCVATINLSPKAVQGVYARGDGHDTPLGLPELLAYLVSWINDNTVNV